jgi:hypothetical protein
MIARAVIGHLGAAEFKGAVEPLPTHESSVARRDQQGSRHCVDTLATLQSGHARKRSAPLSLAPRSRPGVDTLDSSQSGHALIL